MLALGIVRNRQVYIKNSLYVAQKSLFQIVSLSDSVFPVDTKNLSFSVIRPHFDPQMTPGRCENRPKVYHFFGAREQDGEIRCRRL